MPSFRALLRHLFVAPLAAVFVSGAAVAASVDIVDDQGQALPGATGVELLLPLTLRWAQEAEIPLLTALARITSEPAAILGIPAGSLAVGEAADICIFDPEESWCVTPENLRSQGKNIPFPGVEMKGRVKQTLIGGRLVFPF